MAPGGVVLGRVNSRDIDNVLATLERGLEAWTELPADQKRVPEGVKLEPQHRWEHSYPQGGLVLERIVRELDEHALSGQPLARWNRDMCWFSKEEVKAMLPSPLRPGSSFDLSELARRLARFHLVDNARGQTLPFAESELQRVRLRAEAIAKVGDTIVLALEGETLARAKGPWLLGQNLWKPGAELAHGIETKLIGRANVDGKSGAFTDFELLGVARRWGRTQNDGRGKNAEPGRLAFHLLIDRSGTRLAPTFIDLYDRPWVRLPQTPGWIESPAEIGLTDD